MFFEVRLLNSIKKIIHNINVRGVNSENSPFFGQRGFGNFKRIYRVQKIEIRKKRRNSRFFIENQIKKDVRNHHNDLKEDLSNLRQSLIINKNSGQHNPEWIKEVEIVSPLDYSISQTVLNHLKIDKPKLQGGIHAYKKDIYNNINDIKKFKYLTNAVIKNRFIEKTYCQIQTIFIMKILMN